MPRCPTSVYDAIPSLEAIEKVASGHIKLARTLARRDLQVLLERQPTRAEVAGYMRRCADWIRLYGLDRCRQLIPRYNRRPGQPSPPPDSAVLEILDGCPYPW